MSCRSGTDGPYSLTESALKSLATNRLLRSAAFTAAEEPFHSVDNETFCSNVEVSCGTASLPPRNRGNTSSQNGDAAKSVQSQGAHGGRAAIEGLAVAAAAAAVAWQGEHQLAPRAMAQHVSSRKMAAWQSNTEGQVRAAVGWALCDLWSLCMLVQRGAQDGMYSILRVPPLASARGRELARLALCVDTELERAPCRQIGKSPADGRMDGAPTSLVRCDPDSRGADPGRARESSLSAKRSEPRVHTRDSSVGVGVEFEV